MRAIDAQDHMRALLRGRETRRVSPDPDHDGDLLLF
jgi:hypothetical protein